MKSLRIKLFTGISMFVVALASLIVGVWAIGGTQTITMNGSVNFEIADKSLYVKDVRMQEDVNSAPYSLKDQDRFMPGFINGNFDMNLGDFTNSYGSFALYFDIINTMDETTSETFAYTVDQPTAPSGAAVDVSILGTDGTTLEQIPQGTVKPSEISDSTLVTATIKLTIASTSSSTVDLGNITITINQYVPPKVYNYFTFDINEDNQTVTLTDYNKNLSNNTDIVIPATVDLVGGVWQDGTTYTVTAIDNNATSSSNSIFRNSGITSINLPSTLQSIGSYAFYECSGLTSLTLPSSITSIGAQAFGSTNINVVNYNGTLSDWLKVSIDTVWANSWIVTHRFIINGEELINLEVPEGVESINDGLFSYCSGLKSVTLPSTLKSIGRKAFIYCSKLTSISLPSSLTSIGWSAFEGCSGLTSISLPSSLTSIGGRAFYGCSGLTSVDLSGCTSLTSIGIYAFYDCSGLTSISLPSSLTSIGSRAFSDCSALKSVVFPVGSTGWEVSTSSSMRNPISVDVTNPSTNARNLTDKYDNYYWKRNV